MTSPVEVAMSDVLAVRERVGITVLTDVRIGEIIVEEQDADGAVNLDRAAARVWELKATSYAELVDVSESGSSRSLSKLQGQALAMAKVYHNKADVPTVEEVAASSGPRVSQIVRG